MNTLSNNIPFGFANLRCERRVDPIGVGERRPRFSWETVGGAASAIQAAYRIQVARDPDFSSTCWDSGDVASDAQHDIRYGGEALAPRTGYHWRTRVASAGGEHSPWSPTATFETGMFGIDDWQGRWFPYIGSRRSASANHLRTEFDLPADKAMVRARAYIGATCGLHYEDAFRMNLYVLRLNGRKVGRDLYNPGQLSSRRARALYRAFDVSSLLQPGRNAVGIVYASARISLEIHVDFEDGSRFMLDTGSPRWKWAGCGPYVNLWYRDEKSYAYGGRGEVYDARQAFDGWDRAGFDDTAWRTMGEPPPGEAPPVVFSQASAIVSAPDILKEQAQSVEVAATLEPIGIRTLKDGRVVVDFGQDFNGHESIRIRGRRGDRIQMRFGERLFGDGSVNCTTTWGSADEASTHEDVYIKRSDKPEVYAPSFANHGFRHVEIHGLREPLRPGDINAHVVHSTVLNGSRFSCSDAKAQRLHDMCVWSSRSNLMSVPTDCAGRERQGWLSSGALPSGGECANFDMRLFYEKWFADIADSQSRDGSIPLFCPSAPFSDLGVDMLQYGTLFDLPRNAYQAYGERSFLEAVYPTMKGIVDFMLSFPLRNGLSRGHTIWNDWMTERPVDGDFLENAAACFALARFAELADEVGERDEAAHSRRCAEERKATLNRRFLKDGTRYGQINLQTENALALAFGVVPDACRNGVAQALVRDVETRCCVTAGIFGTWALLEVLPACGRNDLVWSLMRSERPRTFGYWLDPGHGLTAVPEFWTKWDEKPHHANHHDFTFINAWFFREMAGLKPLAPGYRKIAIRPFIPADVDSASAAIHSPYGPIESDWRRVGSVIEMQVSVPPGTTAAIDLPVEGGAGFHAEVGHGVHRFQVVQERE